jgi:hypothetical protein
MRFFKEMERIVKEINTESLRVLEHYYGLELELFHEDKNGYSDVYGVHAGNNQTKIRNFIGILVSDDFYSADGQYSGNFEEGFLYTTDKDVKPTDVIKVKVSDTKIRRYKVIRKESIGMQDEVFVRYKLSNLGD